LLTPAEARCSEHLSKPLRDHVDAYIESMKARGVTPTHRRAAHTYLNRLSQDCAFARLTDLSRDALDRWLAHEWDKGRSARSRNAHVASAVSFGRWCVSTSRLTSHPFQGIHKADEKADPRRKRRAMTEEELKRLLEVAAGRPLKEALTVRTG